MKITTLLSPLAVLMLALPLSAQEPAVPDFSKGMPDAKLESKLEVLGRDRTRAVRILRHLITEADTRDVVSADKLKGHLAPRSGSEEAA